MRRKVCFFGHTIRDGGCELVKCLIQGSNSVALKELLREAKYYQLNKLAEYLEELVPANITK